MRRLCLSFALLCAAGCGDSTSTPTDPAPIRGPRSLRVSASPSTVYLSGSSVTITVRVVDGSVSAADVPVTFATDAGTLSAPLVRTDAMGNASATLAASTDATVTVSTPTESAVVLIAARPPFRLSLSGDALATAGTVWHAYTTVTQAPTDVDPPKPQSISVDCGDGTSLGLPSAILNAYPTECLYRTPGLYTVTARATRDRWTTTTTIGVRVVAPASTVDTTPMSVDVFARRRTPAGGNFPYGLQAFVSGDTRRIERVTWDFGDGYDITTDGATLTTEHIYRGPGRYVITCRVWTAGGSYSGRTEIDIAEQ